MAACGTSTSPNKHCEPNSNAATGSTNNPPNRRGPHRPFEARGGVEPVSVQTISTATLSACAARASMSARSPVTTVPPGSAIATTSASTAEPALARRRNSAARRAVTSLTDGSMMHIFKKRYVLASRLESPCSDSTSTIVGTIGGHSSCALKARMSETAVLVRADRRDSPPLSRTSTVNQLDRVTGPGRVVRLHLRWPAVADSAHRPRRRVHRGSDPSQQAHLVVPLRHEARSAEARKRVGRVA